MYIVHVVLDVLYMLCVPACVQLAASDSSDNRVKKKSGAQQNLNPRPTDSIACV